ncbi:transposase [Bacillus sp. 1P02SD]|uniref:transposase n=1 Tax=Bacillus sp. 1P02SD TaxID=3132264 RepID=UPI0039A3F766
MAKPFEELYKKFEDRGFEKGIEKGIEKGRQVGKQEGKKEEKIAIAKKLLIKGLDPEAVVDITGLSLREIEELRKS